MHPVVLLVDSRLLENGLEPLKQIDAYLVEQKQEARIVILREADLAMQHEMLLTQYSGDLDAFHLEFKTPISELIFTGQSINGLAEYIAQRYASVQSKLAEQLVFLQADSAVFKQHKKIGGQKVFALADINVCLPVLKMYFLRYSMVRELVGDIVNEAVVKCEAASIPEVKLPKRAQSPLPLSHEPLSIDIPTFSDEQFTKPKVFRHRGRARRHATVFNAAQKRVLETFLRKHEAALQTRLQSRAGAFNHC